MITTKKNSYSFFIAFAIICFFYKCQNPDKYKTEIVRLTEIKNKLLSINPILADSIQGELDKVIEKSNKIIQQFDSLLPDTVDDMVLVRKISNFSNFKKYFLNNNDTLLYYISEKDSILIRIDNLINDLTKNNISNEEVNKYVETELNKGNTIISSLQLLIEKQHELLEKQKILTIELENELNLMTPIKKK